MTNVRSMEGMLQGASSFNQPLNERMEVTVYWKRLNMLLSKRMYSISQYLKMRAISFNQRNH